ncbi:MAG: hydroxyacid dehydrogenase [Deltaproteobacteria bacterium]|nr:hydroxyacid dehydrogenase [Deltaproteobacteria bacterium]
MQNRPTIALAMLPMLNAELMTDAHWSRLEALCRVPDREALTTFAEPRAFDLLAQAEILLTGWGCPMIDTHVLDQAPQLRAVVHAAGTVKQHMDPVCWQRGIAVTAAAAANAVPVAEYTLAAILFANKRVLRLQQRYREAREFRWWPMEFPRLGNYRKVVGIVGASHVGRKVIELLRPFDLSVVLYDPFVDATAAAALGVRKLELDDLMREADVVSLHAPALAETRHLIDRRRLALMRDGATLINTARGWIVDHAALEEELRSGRIDAILDTTEPEILPAESPLYELPNVFLTPHIAGSMGVETQRMADLALDEIERFVKGKEFRYAIRAEDLARIA